MMNNHTNNSGTSSYGSSSSGVNKGSKRRPVRTYGSRNQHHSSNNHFRPISSHEALPLPSSSSAATPFGRRSINTTTPSTSTDDQHGLSKSSRKRALSTENEKSYSDGMGSNSNNTAAAAYRRSISDSHILQEEENLYGEESTDTSKKFTYSRQHENNYSTRQLLSHHNGGSNNISKSERNHHMRHSFSSTNLSSSSSMMSRSLHTSRYRGSVNDLENIHPNHLESTSSLYSSPNKSELLFAEQQQEETLSPQPPLKNRKKMHNAIPICPSSQPSHHFKSMHHHAKSNFLSRSHSLPVRPSSSDINHANTTNNNDDLITRPYKKRSPSPSSEIEQHFSSFSLPSSSNNNNAGSSTSVTGRSHSPVFSSTSSNGSFSSFSSLAKTGNSWIQKNLENAAHSVNSEKKKRAAAAQQHEQEVEVDEHLISSANNKNKNKNIPDWCTATPVKSSGIGITKGSSLFDNEGVGEDKEKPSSLLDDTITSPPFSSLGKSIRRRRGLDGICGTPLLNTTSSTNNNNDDDEDILFDDILSPPKVTGRSGAMSGIHRSSSLPIGIGLNFSLNASPSFDETSHAQHGVQGTTAQQQPSSSYSGRQLPTFDDTDEAMIHKNAAILLSQSVASRSSRKKSRGRCTPSDNNNMNMNINTTNSSFLLSRSVSAFEAISPSFDISLDTEETNTSASAATDLVSSDETASISITSSPSSFHDVIGTPEKNLQGGNTLTATAPTIHNTNANNDDDSCMINVGLDHEESITMSRRKRLDSSIENIQVIDEANTNNNEDESREATDEAADSRTGQNAKDDEKEGQGDNNNKEEIDPSSPSSPSSSHSPLHESNIPSVQLLGYLISELSKSTKSSVGLLFGSQKTCDVVVPNAWSEQMKSEFLQWCMDIKGFSLRNAGGGSYFLSTSRIRGQEILSSLKEVPVNKVVVNKENNDESCNSSSYSNSMMKSSSFQTKQADTTTTTTKTTFDNNDQVQKKAEEPNSTSFETKKKRKSKSKVANIPSFFHVTSRSTIKSSTCKKSSTTTREIKSSAKKSSSSSSYHNKIRVSSPEDTDCVEMELLNENLTHMSLDSSSILPHPEGDTSPASTNANNALLNQSSCTVQSSETHNTHDQDSQHTNNEHNISSLSHQNTHNTSMNSTTSRFLIKPQLSLTPRNNCSFQLQTRGVGRDSSMMSEGTIFTTTGDQQHSVSSTNFIHRAPRQSNEHDAIATGDLLFHCHGISPLQNHPMEEVDEERILLQEINHHQNTNKEEEDAATRENRFASYRRHRPRNLELPPLRHVRKLSTSSYGSVGENNNNNSNNNMSFMSPMITSQQVGEGVGGHQQLLPTARNSTTMKNTHPSNHIPLHSRMPTTSLSCPPAGNKVNNTLLHHRAGTGGGGVNSRENENTILSGGRNNIGLSVNTSLMSKSSAVTRIDFNAETPMPRRCARMWGSKPIPGNDWGCSQRCDPNIISILLTRFEKAISKCTNGGDTSMFHNSQNSSSFSVLHHSSVGGAGREGEHGEGITAYNRMSQSNNNSNNNMLQYPVDPCISAVAASSSDLGFDCEADSFRIDDEEQEKSFASMFIGDDGKGKNNKSLCDPNNNNSKICDDELIERKRRQKSFAKHKRVSLCALSFIGDESFMSMNHQPSNIISALTRGDTAFGNSSASREKQKIDKMSRQELTRKLKSSLINTTSSNRGADDTQSMSDVSMSAAAAAATSTPSPFPVSSRNPKWKCTSICSPCFYPSLFDSPKTKPMMRSSSEKKKRRNSNATAGTAVADGLYLSMHDITGAPSASRDNLFLSPQDKEELKERCLMDQQILCHIFSFLNETHLLRDASLVCTDWTLSATYAHANMAMMSIDPVCFISDSSTDLFNMMEDDQNMDDSNNQISSSSNNNNSSGSMHISMENFNKLYPTGAFLSDGSFKDVYKVFNSTVKEEEALSVMDIDLIRNNGNAHVLKAELSISILLSSLVRRNICPNFVSIHGVFTSNQRPSQTKKSWDHGIKYNDEEMLQSQHSIDDHYVTVANSSSSSEDTTVDLNALPVEQNNSKTYQYIRMELCRYGDLEELLKKQPDKTLDSNEARIILFQMAFALHAASDRFGLKHYDVKLLNFFLQSVKGIEEEEDEESVSSSEKKKEKSDLPTHTTLRYGIGSHVFNLRMRTNRACIVKLADYGTAKILSDSDGSPVTLAQFTTLENTPPEYLLEGDSAKQGHGHDCFGLGLCMIHLFTGHAPYEEILEDVVCPPNLKKKLRKIWVEDNSSSGFSEFEVVKSVILSDMYEDEEGNIVGEPDEILYDTLYRYLVLFGIPSYLSTSSTQGKASKKVSRAIKLCLEGDRSSLKTNNNNNTNNSTMKSSSSGNLYDKNQYEKDLNEFSLLYGKDYRISAAREKLKNIPGGMELLFSLVSFDPNKRSSPLDVINSEFMQPLRATSNTTNNNNNNNVYDNDDLVYSYMAFSTK